MKYIYYLLVLIILAPTASYAQRKKLDLDNLDIKGELYKDDSLNILMREENQLKNYVKFRTNYRSQIIEALPTPRPGVANR